MANAFAIDTDLSRILNFNQSFECSYHILHACNQIGCESLFPNAQAKDSNPNVPLRIATQFLTYEIVCGLRDPNTFERNSTNECGTSGDIFYNAGAASVPYFAPNYNTLVDTIQSAKKIPSFTSSSSGSAPNITLKGEETSVTDTNGVLAMGIRD